MSETFRKRNLSHQQEHVIRLVHQDFAGLSKKEAAKIMGISVSRLNQILRSAKKKASSLFPILTLQQHTVNQLLNQGKSHNEIADGLGIDVKRVDNITAQLRRQGVYNYKRPEIVSYNARLHDNKIVEKF